MSQGPACSDTRKVGASDPEEAGLGGRQVSRVGSGSICDKEGEGLVWQGREPIVPWRVGRKSKCVGGGRPER